MKLKNIMTRKVFVFSPEDTLHDALRLFAKKRIGGAPVVDKGRLVGLVTEFDIIRVLDIYTPKIHLTSAPHFLLVIAGLRGKRRLSKLEMEVKAAARLKVRDFMSRNPITMKPEADIMDAARFIDKYKINRIIVLNKKKKVTGIVTRNDIIKAITLIDDRPEEFIPRRKRR
jgi:CBS domain-containing protein